MTETSSSDRVFSTEEVLIKHEFLEFLFAELVEMRPIFENDFDAMLIYTAISRHYLRNERAGISIAIDPTPIDFGLTATRIGEQTKIPRETVRRKLNKLASRGFVKRGAREEWLIERRNGQPTIRVEYASEWRRELGSRLITSS